VATWLERNGSFGNFYLRTGSRATGRKNRNLRTNDPAVAQAALDKARAETAKRPWASGNIKWRREDYERFASDRATSKYTQQHHALAARAMSILTDRERWGWLLGPPPRISVLQELGRFELPDLLMAAADEAVERRITGAEARRLFRNVRGTSKRSSDSLSWCLHRAITTYLKRCPIPPSQVAAGLRAVALDYDPPRATLGTSSSRCKVPSPEILPAELALEGRPATIRSRAGC
jgi:hypothetical protein